MSQELPNPTSPVENQPKEKARTGGFDVVPPQVTGSPAEMHAPPLDALSPDFVTVFDGTTPWWRPRMADIAKVIGWRFIFLIPALALVIGIPVMMVYAPRASSQMLGMEIKLLLFSIGVCISTVIWAMKNVTKARKDYFCIHCGYTVDGLADKGTCPECGRGFSRGMIEEYKKDPHFFVDRWRAVKTAPKFKPFAAGQGKTPHDGTYEAKSDSQT